MDAEEIVGAFIEDALSPRLERADARHFVAIVVPYGDAGLFGFVARQQSGVATGFAAARFVEIRCASHRDAATAHGGSRR
jgi:hypothetical protein